MWARPGENSCFFVTNLKEILDSLNYVGVYILLLKLKTKRKDGKEKQR